MDNQIELKPCPFCGGEAIVLHWDGTDTFSVGCVNTFVCHGGTHTSSAYQSEQEAAEAWNRRADNQLSVGDKVYQTNGFNTYESTVKHVLYDTEKITFDSEAIGQSVFLTREEAEKRTMHLALEEAENHDEKS
jgi:Lar family restriction alleviation protein